MKRIRLEFILSFWVSFALVGVDSWPRLSAETMMISEKHKLFTSNISLMWKIPVGPVGLGSHLVDNIQTERWRNVRLVATNRRWATLPYKQLIRFLKNSYSRMIEAITMFGRWTHKITLHIKQSNPFPAMQNSYTSVLPTRNDPVSLQR